MMVCDEARMMSVNFLSGGIAGTKRYRLDQLVSCLTRDSFLMTAVSHNGKSCSHERTEYRPSTPVGHPFPHKA
jgi:hypothetical protein